MLAVNVQPFKLKVRINDAVTYASVKHAKNGCKECMHSEVEGSSKRERVLFSRNRLSRSKLEMRHGLVVPQGLRNALEHFCLRWIREIPNRPPLVLASLQLLDVELRLDALQAVCSRVLHRLLCVTSVRKHPFLELIRRYGQRFIAQGLNHCFEARIIGGLLKDVGRDRRRLA